VDFDHSLNAAVKRLREALDESADNPVFIETLARRGYRFPVPIEPGTIAPESGGKSGARQRMLLGASIAGVCVLLGAILVLVVRLRETRSSPSSNSSSNRMGRSGKLVAINIYAGVTNVWSLANF